MSLFLSRKDSTGMLRRRSSCHGHLFLYYTLVVWPVFVTFWSYTKCWQCPDLYHCSPCSYNASTRSSLLSSDSRRPLRLCFPKIPSFKAQLFLSKFRNVMRVMRSQREAWKRVSWMMLSGELINGKLQSSPSRYRRGDVSLEDDSLFLLLS